MNISTELGVQGEFAGPQVPVNPLQSQILLSYAPLNTMAVHQSLQNNSLFLQDVDQDPIRIGPIKTDKTLVGNSPGLLRIKNPQHGPCEYNGDSYWVYQVKGYVWEDQIYHDKFMKLEAVKPVKSCLSAKDLEAKDHFQNIILPDKLIQNEPEVKKGIEVINRYEHDIPKKKQSSHFSIKTLVKAITNVSDSCMHDQCRFKSKAIKSSRNMDCLDIFEHRSDPEYYYGVYHTMDPSISNFVSYLARSKHGMDQWETITYLEKYSSQAKVWVSPTTDDILFAYEASPGFNGNNIVIKQYSSLEDMKKRQASEEINIERTLGAINEGTPSFEKVDFTGSLQTSNVTLRFHYYYDNQYDQQAIGTYEGNKALKLQSYMDKVLGKKQDSKWTAKSEDNVNHKLRDLGFKGNIGSRQKFVWNQKTFYLLEAQRCIDCWHLWRIILCDAEMNPLAVLPMNTPSGRSKSFANPNILKTANKYLISYFLPQEGNFEHEAGDLIYFIDIPKADYEDEKLDDIMLV